MPGAAARLGPVGTGLWPPSKPPSRNPDFLVNRPISSYPPYPSDGWRFYAGMHLQARCGLFFLLIRKPGGASEVGYVGQGCDLSTYPARARQCGERWSTDDPGRRPGRPRPRGVDGSVVHGECLCRMRGLKLSTYVRSPRRMCTYASPIHLSTAGSLRSAFFLIVRKS